MVYHRTNAFGAKVLNTVIATANPANGTVLSLETVE